MLEFKIMNSMWFNQLSEFDNATAIIYNLMRVLNVKISKTTIYNELSNELGYPSLKAIVGFLKKWDFETATVKIESDALNDIEYPVIALMNDNYYVLLMESSDDEIKYINSKKGWVVETLGLFNSKWSGIVIDMVPGKMSCEKDFEEKVELEKKTAKWNLGRLKVEIIDDFLTSEECDYLIRISQSKFIRTLTGRDGNKSQIHNGVTSLTANLSIEDDFLIEKIYDKGAKILNVPRENLEYLQCKSYKKNDEHIEHHDAFKKSEKDELKLGQRVGTILIYLNNDFKGGGTYFPMIDVRIKPKKGSAAIWYNLLANGERDSDAFHAGLPVINGKKYVVNLWARDRDFKRFKEKL